MVEGTHKAQKLDPQHLQRIATQHALRLGLSVPDAEDCACSFVLHFLEKLPDEDGNTDIDKVEPDHIDAWLQRCAKNHALNYCRGLLRRQQHLAPWCDPREEAIDDGSSLASESPLNSCLRREALKEVIEVLEVLPDQTQHLFIAHHLNGHSLDRLAEEMGMKPNAVSQTLHRARMRVRQRLEERGWTQGDFVHALREYS